MSINQNPHPQDQSRTQPPADNWGQQPPSAHHAPAGYQQLPAVVRPQAPSVAMTVIITLFFGVFGLIAAASASSKATQLGYPTGKYWGAWILVMAAWVLLLVAVVS